MQNPLILCKPTAWFFRRVALLTLMLGGFGIYFIYDYQIGYPKKNQRYFTKQIFEQAHNLFTEKRNEDLSPEEWQAFASQQQSPLRADPKLAPILPKSAPETMPWPAELQDYELMKAGISETWKTYTGRQEWGIKVAETPKDQRKINEQLYFGVGSLVLSLIPLFFLLRTMRRSLAVNATHFQTANGQLIPISDIKRIDLRKWKSKGIANVQAESNGTSSNFRIDGLTYGGFNKEADEPAEKLVQHLLQNFKGEIIDYQSDDENNQPEPPPDSADTKTSEQDADKPSA